METAVITAAGEGSRLLPLTRGMRKEMLPLCAKSADGGLTLKPLLHLILEQLYGAGIRNFCFVLRKGENLWKQYLTLDESYVKTLVSKGKYSEDIRRLHSIVSDSQISFAYQGAPRGFGDAVLASKKFVKDNDFIVHAGDGYIVNGKFLIPDLIGMHSKLGAKAVLISRKVEDATRYGVVSGKADNSYGADLIRVENIVEKSSAPPSNDALIAVYSFNSAIFDSLKNTKPNERTGEIELSDGILNMLNGGKVYSFTLDTKKYQWLSVGSINGYLKAFDLLRANPPD